MTEAQKKAVIGTTWVIQPKGDEVRCRLVVQDYTRERELEDDLTFASTPLLLSLKILLLFAIQKGYTHLRRCQRRVLAC